MPDPYLHALMHGTVDVHKRSKVEAAPQNRFEQAAEEMIKQHVDRLMEDENQDANKMLSFKARRTKREHEIKELVVLNELEENLFLAVQVLQTQGQRYFTEEENLALLEELNKLRSQLVALDPSNLAPESLKRALSIAPEAIAGIFQIGIAKYMEGALIECLAIFALLTFLDVEDPDYWYRLALAAQKNARYELAARAYLVAAQLAPEFIGIPIFAAQCYQNCGRHKEALEQLAEAKRLLNHTTVDEEWRTLAATMENSLLSSI